MKRIGRTGFTLVEIMIVVAIIALLAAIAIPNVIRGRATANESAAVGNMRALVNALEMYRSTNNEYPAAWRLDLYTNATPDYGPPSFDLDLAAAVEVQGYNYIYARTGTAATQTYTLDAYPTVTSNGTRAFFVDEDGTPLHCRCPAGSCTAAVNAGPAAPSTALNVLPGNC